MADFDNLKWSLIAEDKASGTFKKVAIDMKELTAQSSTMQQSLDKGSTSWGNIAKGVAAGQFALEAARKAFDFVKDSIVDSIGQAEEYERVQTQLTAVITSTGGAAGLTLDQLNEMADGMANLSNGGSESINALQGVLLTFTNITSDTFERATMAALDLSTSLNSGVLPTAEELKAQAIQLGKALNDPIKGITALTRVGVEFTEQQVEQIKTLEKAGKTTEAQTLILDELAKEYGGSATAAAQTFQGRMVALNNTINDAKKIIGQALLPTLSLFASGATDLTGKINVNANTLYKWQLGIYQVATIIKGAILTIINFGKGIYHLGRVIYDSVGVMLGVFGDLGTAMAQLGKNFNTLFKAVSEGLSGDFSGALDTLKGGFNSVFSQTRAGLGALGASFGDLVNTLTTGFDPMQQAIAEATNHTAFDAMVNSMNDAEAAANRLGAAGGGLGDLGGSATDAASKVNDALSKMSTDYEGAREDIAQELLKLEQDHADSIDEIVEKLKGLQDTLDETTSKYASSMADLNKTEAEKVVDQEQKLADLRQRVADAQAQASDDQIKAADELAKKEAQLNVLYEKRNELTGTEKSSSRDSLNNQISDLEKTISAAKAGGGDSTGLADLQAQLAQEEKAYNDYIATRTGLDAELTEARRRAGETEFQRFVEDINAKRTEEQTAYDARIAEIQQQVKEQQDALAQENTVYDAKKAMYAEVDAAFQAFHDDYLMNLSSMRGYTTESVAVMTEELARLTKLFQEVKDVRAAAGLAGVDVGSPTDGSTTGATSNATTTNQVTNNISVTVSSSNATASEIVAEITRQLELVQQGSQ